MSLIMSLAQWEALTDCNVTRRNGSISIYDGISQPSRMSLFRLTDHVVSSVSGGSIWLIPR